MLEEGLGEEMFEANRKGDKIPKLDIETNDDDPPSVKSIKRLMLEMTSYHSRDRPTADEILQRVKYIINEARLDVEVITRVCNLLCNLSNNCGSGWKLTKRRFSIIEYELCIVGQPNGF